MLPREGSINDNINLSFPRNSSGKTQTSLFVSCPPALYFFVARFQSVTDIAGETKRGKSQKTPVQASAHLFYPVSIDLVFFLFFFFFLFFVK